MPQAINATLLANLFTGFKTSFQGGFAGVTPDWSKIATLITSSTATEDYAWLEAWPRIREWLGERLVKQLSASKYSITNRDFETTVGVKRNDIMDDRLGIYGPMFTELGRSVAAFPDELIFALLAAGFTTLCYDGQNFFDTDHVVGQGADAATFSNHGGGAGTPWYLLDTSRSLKPLIYQERQPFAFTGLDKPDDVNVFMRKEFIYGSDGRCNVGFGFWQMAFGSKQDLNAANYEAARAAMASITDEAGKSLGVKGNLLVVPGTLEGAGRRLLVNSMNAAGATNEWAGSAELLVAPWL